MINDYEAHIFFDGDQELVLVIGECEDVFEADRHALLEAVDQYGIDDSRIEYIDIIELED